MNKTGNADKTEAVGTSEMAVGTGKFAGRKRLLVILLSVAVVVCGMPGKNNTSLGLTTYF